MGSRAKYTWVVKFDIMEETKIRNETRYEMFYEGEHD